MGNRSKYVVVTAAAATAAAAATRRARLREALAGIRDAILPSRVDDFPSTRKSDGDEAHAPGHQHLGNGGARTGGGRRRMRLHARYAPGMRGRCRDR